MGQIFLFNSVRIERQDTLTSKSKKPFFLCVRVCVCALDFIFSTELCTGPCLATEPLNVLTHSEPFL